MEGTWPCSAACSSVDTRQFPRLKLQPRTRQVAELHERPLGTCAVQFHMLGLAVGVDQVELHGCIGGTEQLAGSKDFGAVFAIEQPLLDALWTLTQP